MDQRLYDATRCGDVVTLHALLNEDPLILEKICLTEFAETPLHVAALAGKTEFAKEIITLMPSFAMELNKDGFAPMHLASARGHVEMVMELLKLDSDCSLCLQRDKIGRIPLHYAVVKGRIPIIEKLISHCSESLQEVTALGETALHLAVKNSQFEALKVLLERLTGLECFEMLLSTKDNHGRGKTLIELAEATKQVQVLELLKEYDASAKSAGNPGMIKPPADNQGDQLSIDVFSIPKTDDKKESVKEGKGKLSKYEQNNLVLVAAVLIVTMTYQALVTPPPRVWREGLNLNAKCILKTIVPNRTNIRKLWQDCPALSFYSFMMFNSAGFLSSVFLIEWVTLPYNYLPFQILSVSIFFLLLNFIVLTQDLAPEPPSQVVLLFVPCGIVFLLFLTIVLLRKAMVKLKKAILKWHKKQSEDEEAHGCEN